MLATEFGKKYRPCKNALLWRESLGPKSTQADAYLVCDHGDWLIWQLTRDPAISKQIHEPLNRAIKHIVTRALHRAQKVLRDTHTPWITAWHEWAQRWLSEEDRTEEAAQAMDVMRVATAKATTMSATEAAAAARSATMAAILSIRAVWVSAVSWALAGTETAARAQIWAKEEVRVRMWAEEEARVQVQAEEAATEARETELKTQACDIRREIPEWPGE